MTDFFISYTQADLDWAEWLGYVLEEEGYRIIIQAWDFRPGSNFILEMQRAATAALRTIMVLSPDYVKSQFTSPEWAAAFAHDPQGLERRILPIQVRKCQVGGILTPIVQIRLEGLSEKEARTRLLDGLSTQRCKPSALPMFPGKEAPVEGKKFPGIALQLPQKSGTIIGDNLIDGQSLQPPAKSPISEGTSPTTNNIARTGSLQDSDVSSPLSSEWLSDGKQLGSSLAKVMLHPPRPSNEPETFYLDATAIVSSGNFYDSGRAVRIGLREIALVFQSRDYQEKMGTTIGERAPHDFASITAGGVVLTGPVDSNGCLQGNLLSDDYVTIIECIREIEGSIELTLRAERGAFVFLDIMDGEGGGHAELSVNKNAVLDALVFEVCRRDNSGKAILASARMRRKHRGT